MKAVVLAAGEGSRMRPLTYSRPKVMLPLVNKPILEHLLLEVKEAGISEFVFVVGYHDEQVRNYFGDGSRWGVSVEYCTQRRRMGTADAIRQVEGLATGNFLVINGDTIVSQNEIGELAKGEDITLSVVELGDAGNARNLGLLEVAEGRVVRIHEKVASLPSSLANAGLYLFTPAIFDAISRTPKSLRGEYEITDSLQLLIDEGQRIAGRKIDYWLDFSYPWDLLAANELLMGLLEPENQGEVEENVVIKGAVAIGKGTVVRSGSYIVGPVIIGCDCDIGPNCYLRPNSAIGDGCRIGGAVELKGAVIMKNSRIPHHSYVGDSIIGEGCNLGAGTKIANLRFDDAEVWVAGVPTGRRKLGAMIGDGVETGINASIDVGTMIGDKACIGPGAVASGVIAPGSKVF